jgi:hypothetical protein
MRTYLTIFLFLLGAAVAVTIGCKKMAESAAESATGGKVKFEGDKVTITGDKGQKAEIDTKGGTAVVKDEKGQEAKITTNSGGMKIESKEGTAEFGAQEAPAGFPLPIYSGAKVMQSMHSTANGDAYTLSATIDAPVKDLATFYEKALKDKGLEVTSTVQEAGGNGMTALAGKKDKLESSVIIMKPSNDKNVTLTITWSAKK